MINADRIADGIRDLYPTLARPQPRHAVDGDVELGRVNAARPQPPRVDAPAAHQPRHQNAGNCAKLCAASAITTLVAVGAPALSGGIAAAVGSVGAAVLSAADLQAFNQGAIGEIASQNAIGGAVFLGALAVPMAIITLCTAVANIDDLELEINGCGPNRNNANYIEERTSPAGGAGGLAIGTIISSAIGIAIMKAAGQHHTTQIQGLCAAGVGTSIFAAVSLVLCCLNHARRTGE